MGTFDEIRRRSIEVAHSLGYEINLGLPLLDETLSIRLEDDIAKRALALHAVVASSYGFPSQKSLEWLQQEGLLTALSNREKKFLQRKENGLSFQLQAECLWVFAWLFNRIETLDFTRPCEDNLVALYPDLLTEQSSSEWRRGNKLRAQEEILQANDLAYCLHWSLNESVINKRKHPSRIKPVVIVERRRALEWVLGQDNWDDVALDT